MALQFPRQQERKAGNNLDLYITVGSCEVRTVIIDQLV